MSTYLRPRNRAVGLFVSAVLAAGFAAAQNTVTGAEFRIDGGTAYSLTLGVPSEIPNLDPPPARAAEETAASVLVDSTGLSIGMHKLETRFFDVNGAETEWFRRWFEVGGPQHIIAAEYFIDTDPGEGSAAAIALPEDGVWDGVEELLKVADIDTSGLSLGAHTAYVRAKDQDGLWSKAYPCAFEVAQPLRMVAAEWIMVNAGTAYDPADPPIAYGSGTPMQAADGVFDEKEEAVTWSGPALYRVRNYDIYVRCLDSLGRWSSYWWNPGETPAPEALQVTPSTHPDIDRDGMANYYEDQYGLSNLDPDDGDADSDNNGLSNRGEFELESNPLDPNSPAHTYYVAKTGADQTTGGTAASPWLTISYAIGRIAASAAPSETAPARILVQPGAYEETFVIPEWVTIAGELNSTVVLRGQFSGDNHSGLVNVRLEAPADSATLLAMNDAAMEVRGVTFAGTAAREAVGILSNGAAAAGATISDCHFERLSVAVDITGTLPRILRSIFENLAENALIIRSGKAKTGTNSLGDVTDPNSGWNRFVTGSIDGYVIRNLSGQRILMQNNDWDTNDPYEIDDAIAGAATFEPYLEKGAGLTVGALCCVVWDAADANYRRIQNATVSLSPSAFPPQTVNSHGVYSFAAIAPGVYTVEVAAEGYRDMLIEVTVPSGKVVSLMFPLQLQTEEGEGQPEGQQEGQSEGHAEGQQEGQPEGQQEGTQDGEGGGETHNHSGDQNNDGKISLTELLRVIQFFNSGGYQCVTPPATSEDGYLPGAGSNHSCGGHSSDYAPHDWKVNLSELLRLIQFFNIGGYHACPGQSTEDGYCTGA